MATNQPESQPECGGALDQGAGVICLVGATGTGKTAAVLTLAAHYPITVINADSRQVYRDLPIITAQPGSEEQARCPHRLYGFLDLNTAISAGRFVQAARRELAACREAGRVPVLVGGTGLYLRALAGGLADIPDIPSQVRARVLQWCTQAGPEALHVHLSTLDPVYATKIHPRDRQRVCRALEVHQATGRTLSWWHDQSVVGRDPLLNIVGLKLPRADLHARLARRIDLMLEMGAVAEIKNAWQACPQRSAPGFSGIGCRELLDHVDGCTTLDQARQLWLHRTRAYAKRQETWFNAIEKIHWIAAGDTAALLNMVRQSFLRQAEVKEYRP